MAAHRAQEPATGNDDACGSSAESCSYESCRRTGPKVLLRWSAPSGGKKIVGYRVTPQLLAAANPTTEPLAYAPIETGDTATQLDLTKIVSIGGRYRFQVQAIDDDDRLSPAATTEEVVVGTQTTTSSR
ncbi:MAG: hypothetical protein QM775_33030 [Pirellulales bacterium]